MDEGSSVRFTPCDGQKSIAKRWGVKVEVGVTLYQAVNQWLWLVQLLVQLTVGAAPAHISRQGRQGRYLRNYA
jgi:hypothetical protein